MIRPLAPASVKPMFTVTWLTGIIGFIARLRRDQPAQHEARAEALRGRQRGVGVVAEIGVDLGLRDLLADLLRRVRREPERAQPRVDRLEMRPVVLLLRRDVAVRLHLADDHHDLPALEVGAAGRRQLCGDAILPRGLLGLRGASSGCENLKPCAPRGSRRQQDRARRAAQARTSVAWRIRKVGARGRRVGRPGSVSPTGPGNPVVRRRAAPGTAKRIILAR